MISAFGGRGMYSLAPAWIAATAALASFSTPQAATGMWMRSTSSRADQVGDVELDVDHHQIGAFARAQGLEPLIDGIGVSHLRAPLHRHFGGGRQLSVQRADDQQSHIPAPVTSSPAVCCPPLQLVSQPRSDLMISVMVTPRRSSTITTSPRATRRLFT